jgi:hypothetical protein
MPFSTENCELEENIALMRTTVVTRIVRSVSENVGGGRGEIDREVMTDSQPVVLHPTSYFYNWPVRIWPICRPEGAVGTHSPWCRSQWSYNIPWPLCSLWWGDNWPHGAPGTGTDPPKIGALECASSRTSARSTTWELGTFLLRTNHLRTAQVF